MVSFGDAIRTFYRRYTDFQGRSQRSEYWWFILFFYASLLFFYLVATILGGASEPENMNILGLLIFGIMCLWVLAHLIGLIALAVRRFHDLGQTGWLVLVFALVGLIPLIGFLSSLANLIWFALPGNQGPNQYGPDPLTGDQPDIF